MNSIDEQTIRTLRALIEICQDGQRGFETAAGDARAGELSQLFLAYAQERGEYVKALQAQVAALGGDAGKSGSVGGSLHRGWMNLKSAMASDEPHAVLVECERGEDAAVEAYREALETALDPESRKIVAHQARAVQATHDRLKQLRDSTIYAKV
jgi:uncharacterized protein (TIGR02284 family)